MTDIVARLRNPPFGTESSEHNLMWQAANEIEFRRNLVTDLLAALNVLLEEAEGFSVSGVYFNEKCMNHRGPDLARAAIAKAEGRA